MNWSTAIKYFPSYLNLFLINRLYHYFYFFDSCSRHRWQSTCNCNPFALATQFKSTCNCNPLATHLQSTCHCNPPKSRWQLRSTRNCNPLAIHCKLQHIGNPLAIAIHLQSTCNPLAMATHLQANGNRKSNAAHHVPAHTMHIAMNWSTDVTGMQVLNNFHRCYRCDVILHLQGNCNYACDAICDILQVRSACNTSQRSMCICSRALSTLWIVASSVCILHPSPATPHPAWK